MNQIKIDFQLTPIGVVQSSLKTLKECPLQGIEGAPEAFLKIAPEFREALAGIVVGSEVVLLTWLHLSNRNVLQCRTRYETETPLVGVFSTRSPDRPNPVGLHRVKVLEIAEEGVLRVFPLETLDGTPILDIKPFLK